MEAGESLVVAATRRPVNVGLDHAVAVRTGPPGAAPGFSRVNTAAPVEPGEATSPRSSATQGPEWTPKLVEERNLEGMMSKPPNILVQFLKSSPEMPVWWRVEFCWSNGRWRHCT